MLNFIAIAILPTLLSSSAYSKSENFVQTNGSNVSVYNEVTVSTNGEETKVISNEAGSISVKSENGKISITKSPQINPTIIQKKVTPTLIATPTAIINDDQTGISISASSKVLDFFKKIVLKCSLLIGNIYKR